MAMSQAVLCDEVVRTLFNDGTDPDTLELEYPTEAKALASFVKTHRINIRKLNVIDVIHILWPPFELDWNKLKDEDQLKHLIEANPPRFRVRELKDTLKAVDISQRSQSALHERDLKANVVVYDVTFPDESSGMVIVEDGIGVEYLAF